MRLLVTGGTGHTGGLFLAKLTASDIVDEVRILTRRPDHSAVADTRDSRFKIVTADLDDRDAVAAACTGVDTVLHIAGIRHTPLVHELARDKGVRRLILVHTTGRFSTVPDAARDYVQIEDDVLNRNDDIDVTVLRPTMIYGDMQDRNMSRLIDYVARHSYFPMFGAGRSLMQPVHADDLAEAYLRVLENPQATRNREYNLSGGTALTYRDVVETISRHLGKRTRIISVPLGVAALAVRIYGRLTRHPRITVEQVLRLAEDKCFSHEDATRDFGYTPRSFEDGIRAEVDEYLASRKRP